MPSFRNRLGDPEELRAPLHNLNKMGFGGLVLNREILWVPDSKEWKRQCIMPGLQRHATIEYVIYYARDFRSQLRCVRLQYGAKQSPLRVSQKRQTRAGTGERDEVSGIHEELTRLTCLHPLKRKLKGCKAVVFVSSSKFKTQDFQKFGNLFLENKARASWN